jgi:hypothetical protein
MLVREEDGDMSGLLAVAGLPLRSAYEGMLAYLARRYVAPLEASSETVRAPWQPFVATAMQAAASGPAALAGKASMATAARTVRRVKAFFIVQKVNGRNAP